MAILDTILSSVGEKLGIPGAAGPLLSWLLSFMTDPKSGGVSGFVDKLKGAGLGSQVSQILSGNTKIAFTPEQVESVLGGKSAIASLASKIGVPEGAAAAAAGMAIPRLLGALTPGGKVAERLPSEIDDFIRGHAIRVAEPTRREPEPVRTQPHREPERRATTTTTHREPERSNDWWKWLLPLLALGALGLFAVRSCTPPEEPAPAPAPVVRRPVEPVATPPAQPVQPVVEREPVVEPLATAVAPRLVITREPEGRVRATGTVRSETARDTLIAALNTAFGEPNVTTDLVVDPNVAVGPWADKLGDLLKLFAENPAAGVSMEGDRVVLGGELPEATRATLIETIRKLLGDTIKFD